MEGSVDVVARAQAGSREAFSQLLRRYQAPVRGYIARYVRDAESVNDLAQEVFLSAHRQLASYRGEAPFLGWLVGIGRRLVANHLREQLRQRRRAAHGFDWVLQQELDEAEAEARGPQRIEDELAALESCLERLHPRSAGLVSEFYFENRSAAEIGGRIGKTDRAVRMLLLRIRAALRSCVDGKLAPREA